MTILAACDQASKLLRRGTGLSAVYVSTDAFALELGSIANEAAPEIAKRHDWRKLMVLKTQAGDGTTTGFDLPADYDRMPVKAEVFLNSTKLPMSAVNDMDVWLSNRLQSYSSQPSEWTILGGQLHFFPAMGASDSAKFYYLTTAIVDPVSGVNKTAFTIDTDTFLLPDRLMTLALIWRWRQAHGYDYAQDFDNFEMALSQEIARDKGSRMLTVGTQRVSSSVRAAYPFALLPPFIMTTAHLVAAILEDI